MSERKLKPKPYTMHAWETDRKKTNTCARTHTQRASAHTHREIRTQRERETEIYIWFFDCSWRPAHIDIHTHIYLIWLFIAASSSGHAVITECSCHIQQKKNYLLTHAGHTHTHTHAREHTHTHAAVFLTGRTVAGILLAMGFPPLRWNCQMCACVHNVIIHTHTHTQCVYMYMYIYHPPYTHVYLYMYTFTYISPPLT
jgi:hypothetical protein